MGVKGILLFLHKGLDDTGPLGIESKFAIKSTKIIYTSAVFEDDDDLTHHSELELKCTAGLSVVCEHSWQLSHDHKAYTMWFDTERIVNMGKFTVLPLTVTARIDGVPVLTKQASLVMHLDYSHLKPF